MQIKFAEQGLIDGCTMPFVMFETNLKFYILKELF